MNKLTIKVKKNINKTIFYKNISKIQTTLRKLLINTKESDELTFANISKRTNVSLLVIRNFLDGDEVLPHTIKKLLNILPKKTQNTADFNFLFGKNSYQYISHLKHESEV